MDPKLVTQMIETYRTLSELYRRAADDACETHRSYDVYTNIKEANAIETKIRGLKVRYLTPD